MNHPQNLLAALAHIESAMGCESTVAELAPHITREQAAFISDHADWCRELLAARPAIKPATAWRSPTEVRREVERRTGECAAVIERGRRRRR